MPYATYRFNKIIAAETIRFIVTVAIVVYEGLKLVVYRMLTSVPQWSSLHLGYLGAMFLLICVFILARYRKARVQALLNRYRRSKHISTVQAYFLFLLPFVLFFLETWLFDEWGWTDCVRWNK